MRRCVAKKLPRLVVKVKVDTERAGCFAEQQVQLGLVVDEAISETRDRLGAYAERTNSKLNTRFGAVHGGKGRGGTGRVPKHTHLSRHGRGVPQERGSHRFPANHRERLPMLVREKSGLGLALPKAGVPWSVVFLVRLKTLNTTRPLVPGRRCARKKIWPYVSVLCSRLRLQSAARGARQQRPSQSATRARSGAYEGAYLIWRAGA